MSMSDASKNVLRRQVLELRSAYRVARKRWQEAQKELESAHSTCQVLRDSIQTLQMDCGDPTEIDPSYPDDVAYFKPLRGIPCSDQTCTLYRNMNGGCDVCGALCL